MFQFTVTVVYMGQLLLLFDGFKEAGRCTRIINVYGVSSIGRLVGMLLQCVINSIEQKTSVSSSFRGRCEEEKLRSLGALMWGLNCFIFIDPLSSDRQCD